MDVFNPEIYHADVVVWLLVARGFFMVCSSLLFLFEPMNCGGRNKILHYILSLTFFAASLNAFDRAQARATSWGSGCPQALAAESLVLTEILVLSVTIALVLKLSYDYFRFRELKQIRPECKSDYVHDEDCPMNHVLH